MAGGRLRPPDGGERAHEELDADVDVVPLDRPVPDLSGEGLPREIRDRDVGCRVAMVTAVEPGFDIAELPFDTYVSKPVDETTMREIIDRLAARARHDDLLREHYAVAEKLAVLEERRTDPELAASSTYQDLLDRFEELESARSDGAAALDRNDIVRGLVRAEEVAERLDETPGRDTT